MNSSCQSCGMAIDHGAYCAYCLDERGVLQTFDVRFERMVQWALQREPKLSRNDAERRTRAYMRTMPAWCDHPRLKE